MGTIDKGEIDDIAKRVATEHLGVKVSGAVSSSTVDSMGRDALEVKIVLTPGSTQSVTGVIATTTVFALNQALLKAGEERFPIVRWVTEPSAHYDSR